MKKILTALLVVLSVFALVSCSSSTVATTEVKLNITNSYTATASLAKEPTTKCGLYYKSGSTSTGYIPATDGVVPVFDASGAKIGNAVVKYVADKLLGFGFVTDIEKSASGTAEVTVGVLSNGTMDPYGIYKIEVVYTYIAPPEPEPIKPYTDTIDLVGWVIKDGWVVEAGDEDEVKVRVSCSGNIMALLDYKSVGVSVGQNCFKRLFKGCKALISAPELPATTLGVSCYEGMFQDCENLMNAPYLPAGVLVDGCYRNMFNGCKALKISEGGSYPIAQKVFTSPANFDSKCVNGMFGGTGGSFTGNVGKNNTYYWY